MARTVEQAHGYMNMVLTGAVRVCESVGGGGGWKPPHSVPPPSKNVFVWLVSQGLLVRSRIVWAVSQENSSPLLVARWASMRYRI